MEKNKIVVLLVVLAVGVGIGYFWGGSNTGYPQANQHMMQDGSMMHNSTMGMGDAMSGMMAGLYGKTGDEFDRAFLLEMIMHHEGAVVMAQAALRDAKHQEIKDMANDIISAQTREINQMREWLNDWYGQ